MLIAESGATKTEWRLIEGEELTLAFRTSGFNPNVMTEEAIRREMGDIFKKNLAERRLDRLYFYGAGLRLESQRKVIERILNSIHPELIVEVAHDLVAAARSTGFDEGIVGILGTGSNTCYYKYGKILEQKGGHGFIFGDEGSGADLGKHLIKGLLEDRFPPLVRDFIVSQEGVEVEELKLAIYRSEKPNVRMARLSKHLDEIYLHDSVREMILERFHEFLSRTICHYPFYQTLPISFVGSIAFYFREILETACRERGISDPDIRHDPIDRLVDYHLRQLQSQA